MFWVEIKAGRHSHAERGNEENEIDGIERRERCVS
jgi:hypothetical protein